jgi:hypothetical protein
MTLADCQAIDSNQPLITTEFSHLLQWKLRRLRWHGRYGFFRNVRMHKTGFVSKFARPGRVEGILRMMN